MAIVKAISLRLLLRHLLSKILTVFYAGVGRFLFSHDQAVVHNRIVGVPHDSIVTPRWIRIYLKKRLADFFSIPSHLTPPINYLFRFYPLRLIMADNVRRALQNINLGIDDTPVALPQAIVQRAVDDNRFCLLGRHLMPRNQNLRQILTTLPRTWGLVGFVRGRIIQNRRFQFIFPSEESLDTVLRRGPWSFADRMLVVERWTPDMDPLVLNFIPFWIQVREIPLQFLNLEVIDNIAGSLGERMAVDFDPSTTTRVEFVRIQIKWDVNHPLRFQRNYQYSPGVNTVLSFYYERLRGFCDVCGRMTYDAGSCVLQNGALHDSDGDDDNAHDDQEFHGNPGVHIQEIGDDGQPIQDGDEVGEEIVPGPVGADVNEAEEEVSDIDPTHNALEDISSDNDRNMFHGEWTCDEDLLYNPVPSFANATGDILGPVELLSQELRKRKHNFEVGEASGSSRRRKITSQEDSEGHDSENSVGSEDNINKQNQGRAAVGPVPPQVP